MLRAPKPLPNSLSIAALALMATANSTVAQERTFLTSRHIGSNCHLCIELQLGTLQDCTNCALVPSSDGVPLLESGLLVSRSISVESLEKGRGIDEVRSSRFIERALTGVSLGAGAVLIGEMIAPEADNLPYALYLAGALSGVAVVAAAREGVRVGPFAVGAAVGATPWLLAWSLDRADNELSLLFGFVGVITLPVGAAVGQGRLR